MGGINCLSPSSQTLSNEEAISTPQAGTRKKPLPSERFQDEVQINMKHDHDHDHDHDHRRNYPLSKIPSSEAGGHTVDLLDDEHNNNHYDTFKADVSLHRLDIGTCSLSRNNNYLSDPDTGDTDQDDADIDNHIDEADADADADPSVGPAASFSNSSCISSLSADETTYELDDKTVKSLEQLQLEPAFVSASAPKSFVNMSLSHGVESRSGSGPAGIPTSYSTRQRSRLTRPRAGISRPSNLTKHSRSISKGTDFRGAFDHLDHLIHTKDLLDADADIDLDIDSLTRHRRSNSGGGNSGSGSGSSHHIPLGNQLAQPVDKHRYQHQQRHQRAHTSNMNMNMNHLVRKLERPKPLHLRSQSDTHAFRPARGHSSSRLTPIASLSKHGRQKSVAAHATLRECLDKSKENELEKGHGRGHSHGRILSLGSKPQILSARSTSVTVQSAASTTNSYGGGAGIGTGGPESTGVNGGDGGGVVWNGQPIENLVGGTPSPSRTRKQLFDPNLSVSVPIAIAGGHGHGNGHKHTQSEGQFSCSHQSMESGASFFSQTQSHSDASFGLPGSASISASAYTASIGRPTSSASSYRTHQTHHTHRTQLSVQSTRGESVDQSTGKNSYTVDDRTTASVSTTSTAKKKNSDKSRRKKNPIKEELKFVLKRLVPSPLKKVALRRNKLNLERSGGCLT